MKNNVNPEEPKSARRNKYCWQFWRFCKDLEPIEVSVLISKRKKDLKYTTDSVKIKEIRTEISILEDTYKILKRKRRN